MMKPILSLSCIVSLLCACSPFKPNDERAGICNQLNSQIIFTGGTGDTRTAEIQRAEEPMVQRSYDNKCL